MATFNTWLNTFVEEKDFDLDHAFEIEAGELHIIPLGAVIETMRAWPKSIQAQAKAKLIAIDFANADAVPFFKGIAGIMATNKYTNLKP